MNSSSVCSVSSSSLIDAKLREHPACGSIQCPSCGHKLDRNLDWVGLPAGVKFDPTDQELIEHLEAKVRAEGSRSHPLIDEFIPTIEGEDGICYTHPEKLPGATRDGLSKHFFHRPSKAYTTGTRKRRKIQSESDIQRGETRWHKTGKTRPVVVNGTQKGCKKILVLYTNFGKHRKPVKTNWIMHQYHLGELEEEKDGELVVSKVFYQTQPRQWSDKSAAAAVEGMSQRRDSEVLSKRDEYLYSQHVKPDNFSFAPFPEGFSEVAVGEVSDEHAEHGRHVRPPPPYHHVARQQQQQQQQQWRMATATAGFHSRRPPMNPFSKFVSTPLPQTSIVLEEPYQVPRMLLQPDKFQSEREHVADLDKELKPQVSRGRAENKEERCCCLLPEEGYTPGRIPCMQIIIN
ncbi:hypothetical protein B296_00017290 [Ensete ventricosum]|uniref:NAC domain-containing protein n=1 Tax=Ensete ventricosum TaxID=4639 RepID=A0A427AW46_ENSVE|nr:hypothetical protein B296_00017290 [Ensete ventricosum]